MSSLPLLTAAEKTRDRKKVIKKNARRRVRDDELTSLKERVFNSIFRRGDATEIAKALQKFWFLTTLNLKYNDIGDNGVKRIARALQIAAETLQHVTNLFTLNLSWNRIGNDGAIAIAGALKYLTFLTTLDLNFNNIHFRWRKSDCKRAAACSKSHYTRFESK